ncbi:unnamed protein product [Arctogadus glacialis]
MTSMTHNIHSFSHTMLVILILEMWYENPDFDLFTSYVRWRQDRPDQPFYILHPAYLWRLWDVIQSNTQENIQPNPPSSGFIGTALHTHSTRPQHIGRRTKGCRDRDCRDCRDPNPQAVRPEDAETGTVETVETPTHRP